MAHKCRRVESNRSEKGHLKICTMSCRKSHLKISHNLFFFIEQHLRKKMSALFGVDYGVGKHLKLSFSQKGGTGQSAPRLRFVEEIDRPPHPYRRRFRGFAKKPLHGGVYLFIICFFDHEKRRPGTL